MKLTKGDKAFCLTLARESLCYFIKNGQVLPDPEVLAKEQLPSDSFLFKSAGCFVTLKDNKNRLRGGIGNVTSDLPLYQNILYNAIAAGEKDPRFSPVTEEEFCELHFEIAILSKITKVSVMDEITPGTHGLIVMRDSKQGLLLPQVANEWELDAKEFVEQTCLKAGLEKEAYLEAETEVFLFTVEDFAEQS